VWEWAAGFVGAEIGGMTGVVFEMELPANETGLPMTYMADGKQFIVVAIGARNFPAELIALALP
jgi:quinoprotein glucose dehydrogenase